jgi:hypothetical protein
LPCPTAQEVLSHGFPERNISIGRISAEDHHVGEIAALFEELGGGGSWRFAVDAACGEDGEDSVDYYAPWWKEEIAGIVLGVLIDVTMQ